MNLITYHPESEAAPDRQVKRTSTPCANSPSFLATATAPLGAASAPIPNTRPVIERIFVDPEGNLYVKRFGDSVAASFDVFDAEGRFLGRCGATSPSLCSPHRRDLRAALFTASSPTRLACSMS